jgi:hypothetical protein
MPRRLCRLEPKVLGKRPDTPLHEARQAGPAGRRVDREDGAFDLRILFDPVPSVMLTHIYGLADTKARALMKRGSKNENHRVYGVEGLTSVPASIAAFSSDSLRLPTRARYQFVGPR